MPAWFRKYFCIAWIAANTVVFFPWAMFLELTRLFGSRGSTPFVQGLWPRLMLWAPGAKLEIEGREHLDPNRTTVFVSNHQSTLDIPSLLIALWPNEVRFVAKKIIKYVPLFGWYMAFTGHVFVDRSSKRAGLQSLKDAAAKISAGTSIVIFPEGTRSETGEVLPFKKGTFALATLAGVAICPVAIEGSRLVMPKARWDVRPGTIRVKIGAPIDPKPFGNDREGLARAVRAKIIDLHLQIGGLGGDKTHALDHERKPSGAAKSATDTEVEA